MLFRSTSSALDLALAARKPVALSRSSYFSHAHAVPGVWVEENSLLEIMERGIDVWDDFLKVHSEQAVLDAVERPLEKYL